MRAFMRERVKCLAVELVRFVFKWEQHAGMEEHMALDAAVTDDRGRYRHAAYNAVGRRQLE